MHHRPSPHLPMVRREVQRLMADRRPRPALLDSAGLAPVQRIARGRELDPDGPPLEPEVAAFHEVVLLATDLLGRCAEHPGRIPILIEERFSEFAWGHLAAASGHKTLRDQRYALQRPSGPAAHSSEWAQHAFADPRSKKPIAIGPNELWLYTELCNRFKALWRTTSRDVRARQSGVREICRELADDCFVPLADSTIETVAPLGGRGRPTPAEAARIVLAAWLDLGPDTVRKQLRRTRRALGRWISERRRQDRELRQRHGLAPKADE